MSGHTRWDTCEISRPIGVKPENLDRVVIARSKTGPCALLPYALLAYALATLALTRYFRPFTPHLTRHDVARRTRATRTRPTHPRTPSLAYWFTLWSQERALSEDRLPPALHHCHSLLDLRACGALGPTLTRSPIATPR